MRKRNYFRSGVAFVLAASMLGSQVAASEISVSTLTDTGGAGTQSAADVFSDGTGSVTEETVFGSADEGGLFSDGTEVSEGTEVLDSSYKEEEAAPLSVTSVLTVEEAQELLNTYEVHAQWTIQNAQEQAVSLALGLDRLTYAALPEALMADSEGICRIPAGEDTTIPMTLQNDPQDENRVLLTWEQTGDGQITADFTVSEQEAEADGLSTIKALWYDTSSNAWTEAAKADLTWTKAPETTPSGEENPETPEDGQTPPAENPEPTQDVAPTENPEPTQDAAGTEPTQETEPATSTETDPAITPAETEVTPTADPTTAETTPAADPTTAPEETAKEPTTSPTEPEGEPTAQPTEAETEPSVTPTDSSEGTALTEEENVQPEESSKQDIPSSEGTEESEDNTVTQDTSEVENTETENSEIESTETENNGTEDTNTGDTENAENSENPSEQDAALNNDNLPMDSTADAEEETAEELLDMEAFSEKPMLLTENDVVAATLDSYITNVTFRQKGQDGIWYDVKQVDGVYPFIVGDKNLEFNLEYTIPAGVVTKDKNVVTYKLPASFNYADQSGKIKWEGSNAGDYTIKDGMLTLIFDPNSTFFDTDVEFNGFVKFASSASSDGTSDKKHYEFNDKVKIDYTVGSDGGGGQTSTDSSFNVGKQGNLAPDKSKIDYTLNVTPGGNGATNVTFKDKLEITGTNVSAEGLSYKDITVKDSSSGQILTKLNPLNTYASETKTETIDGVEVKTVTYKDGSGNVVCTQTTKNGNTVTTPSKGYYLLTEGSDGAYQFSLPDMASTDKYEVTYSLDLTPLGSDRDWKQSINFKNKVIDSKGNQKSEITTTISNRWITKKHTSTSTTVSGDFEMGWEIVLNPDRKDMELTDTFTDTLNVAAGVQTNNGKVTVTVSDGSGNIIPIGNSNTTEVDFSQLEGKSIQDILNKLGVTIPQDATSVPYTIKMEYTTTVESETLPNGTSTVTNTGTLNRGGEGNSSSGEGKIENNLLTKKFDDSTGASFVTEKYYSSLNQPAGLQEEEVILLPWNCIVKIPEGADEGTRLIDTFEQDNGNHILWATPGRLQSTLKVTCGRETLTQGTDYVIYYSFEDKDYTYEDLKEVLQGKGLKDEEIPICQIEGFSIKLTNGGLQKLKGKTANLSYQLYGRFADINIGGSNEVTRTYQNKVNYGSNNSDAKYSVTTTYFGKHGGFNGYVKDDQAQDIDSIKDGELTWRLEAKLSGSVAGRDLTFTDYLPEGLNLVHLGLLSGLGQDSDRQTLLDPGSESSIADGNYTCQFIYKNKTVDLSVSISTLQNKKRSISVTIPGSIVEGGGWFFLYVHAKMSDDSALRDPADFEHTSVTFKNEAELSVNGNTCNKAEHNLTVTTKKSHVDKSGEFLADNSKMHYTLEINPTGADLLKDGDYLTLFDELHYDPAMTTYENSIDLVSGTVKAYYYEKNDTEKENKIYLPANGYDFSYTYEKKVFSQNSVCNALTFQIPDSLTVYLEYDYQLYANQSYDTGHKFCFNNTARLEGVSNGDSQDNQALEFQVSQAGVSKNAITFYKVDRNNYKVKLYGAEFKLYYWQPYSESFSQNMAEQEKHNNPDSILFEEKDGKGCWRLHVDKNGNSSFTSDNDGKFVFSGLKMQRVYRLIETKAPAGYVKNEKDYYFYIHASSEDLTTPGIDGLNPEVLSGGNLIFIPNEDDKKIHATKVWEEGVPHKKIEFTLYQGTGAGYTFADTVGENPKLTKVTANGIESTKIIEANAEGEKLSVEWEKLPEKDENGKKLYYYVFETRIDDQEPKVMSDGNVVFSDGSTDICMPEYNNNIGITSGNIVVFNKKPVKKEIKAKKVWGNAASPVDVELTLYRSTKKHCTYADLSASEGEQPALQIVKFPDGSSQTATKKITVGSTDTEVTWTDLPAYDENGNVWYYYVFETRAGDDSTPEVTQNGTYKISDYDVTYKGNGVKEGTVTVTNDATEVTVNKKWKDEQKYPVTMTLYSSTQKLEPQKPSEEVPSYKIGLRVYSDKTLSLMDDASKCEEFKGTRYYILGDLTEKFGDTVSASFIYWGDPTLTVVDDIVIECSDPTVKLYPLTTEGDGNLYSGITKVFTATNINKDCTFYINMKGSNINIKTEAYAWSVKKGELPVADQPSNLLMPEGANEVASIKLGAENEVPGVSTTALAYTWKNLPKTDADGNPLYYYVKETAVNDKPVDSDGIAEFIKGIYEYGSYQYGDTDKVPSENGEGYPEVTVTNKPVEIPKFTDLTVKKDWKNASGEIISKPPANWTAKFKLYQQQEDKNWIELEEKSFTLPENDKWEKRWTDLPYGNYYVEEVEVNGIPVSGTGAKPIGFTVEYKNSSSADKTFTNASESAVQQGTITVVNTEEPTDIYVQKIWDDGNSSSRPQNIEVALYRSTEQPLAVGENEGTIQIQVKGLEKAATLTDADTISVVLTEINDQTPEQTIVLSKDNWNKKVTVPLCLVDQHGNKTFYQYHVQVTKNSEHIESITPERIDQVSAGESVVITAVEKIEKKTLTIKTANPSSWYADLYNNGAEKAIVSGSARIGIPYDYSQDTFGDKFATSCPLVCNDRDVIITYERSEKSGIYCYYYFIVTGITKDCEITIDKNEYPKEIVSLYTIEDIGTSAVMMRSAAARAGTNGNAEVEENAGLRLSASGVVIEKGTLSETIYTKASDPASKLVGEITVPWKYTWKNLPKTSPTGELYYYYVVETVPNGYTASYTYDENGNVTIKNTKPESPTTEITVAKDWSGDKVTNDHSTYSVKVQLYDSDNNPIGDPQILNQGNSWTYTWPNLDKTKTYYVMETEVLVGDPGKNILNAFTVTYSNGETPIAEGSITITNSRDKPGIILPGTGSKYPLVFYGLGLAFLLVSTVWMLLTLKKRNTLIDAGEGGQGKRS